MAAMCATSLLGAGPRAEAQLLSGQGTGTKNMKIYLAGPLGFSEAGRWFYGPEIVDRIQRLGHVPLDPWARTPPPGIDPRLATRIVEIGKKISAVEKMDYGPEKQQAWRELNKRIGEKNVDLIHEADMVFAVLDGTDVDSGTAAEIGYAFAKGLPILGYRGDFRLSADNDGSIVNLQVEYFIRASGGTIIVLDKPDDKLADKLGDALAKIKRPAR
jgi:nucleoside 2-deoxyribosyltransferase